MPGTRGRSFLAARTNRAVATQRVFPYLALTTLVIGVLAGFVVTLVDKRDFPTFGDGVWWAIVTLGTVGYGDIVPHTAWGRVVGSVVIVFGVTFIAFLTAIVTSAFVSAAEQKARAAGGGTRGGVGGGDAKAPASVAGTARADRGEARRALVVQDEL